MKKLLAVTVLLLACSPAEAQRTRAIRAPETADVPIMSPTTGVPVYVLRPISPSGRLTVRIKTYADAPWTNQTWLSQQRTNASGQLVVLVLREIGPWSCSIGSITIPPAPNQIVDYTVNLSQFRSEEAIGFEAWPTGYEVYLLTDLPRLGSPDGLLQDNKSQSAADRFRIWPHGTWPEAGTCPP